MKIGMVGLGKMGANMSRRLMKKGHDVVVYDLDTDAVAKVVADGADGAADLGDLIGRLQPPRVVWVMVPAGEATEKTIDAVVDGMDAGDIVIDGGNSFYKDGVRRARAAADKGVRFIDVGTSGGVWGIDRGYCLMIGGDADAVRHADPIFKALAPGRGDLDRTPGRESSPSTAEEGYLHCGPAGAGHFVKMVHNGIEYGVMQAYAEGFDLLRNASKVDCEEAETFDLQLEEVAEVWRRGSVIGSWLLDLSAAALLKDPKLAGFEGFVHDSGEGRWTVHAGVEAAVPLDVISAALFTRFRSRQEHTFAEKLLSAMRYQFGGHEE